MAGIAHLVGADWRAELADNLQLVVDRLRSGELTADQGLLVLRNGDAGLMHKPVRLGRPQTTTEALGLLSYGSMHLFQTLGDPE